MKRGERAGRGVVDARGHHPCQHKHVANLFFFLSKQISRLIAEFGGRCRRSRACVCSGGTQVEVKGEKKKTACGKESWTQRRMTKTLLICFACKPVQSRFLDCQIRPGSKRVVQQPIAFRLPTTSRADARTHACPHGMNTQKVLP